jgi:CubicO group peptidase (beta-lactamase class C family)
MFRAPLVLLLIVSACRPADPSGELESLADRAVAASTKEVSWAGLTLGVAQRGRTFVKAYGRADLENEVPARADSVFAIGSISKSFAAAGILRLMEAGKLTLEDKLGVWVPEMPARWHDVTLRQLLGHTSGIRDFEYEGDWAKTKAVERTKEEVLAVFADRPPVFPAGTRWGYSTSGYYLLTLVIERAAKEPWETWLAREVIARAGLEATRPCDSAALIPRRAAGYTLAADGKTVVRAAPVHLVQFGLGGALCSTASDLLRWAGALAEEGRLLTAPSILLMRTATTLSDGSATPYGLGLFLGSFEGHRTVSHSGSVPGFSTLLATYPDDDLVIVVLANQEAFWPGGLERAMATELLGVGAVHAAQLTRPELDRLVGRYGGMSLGFSADVQVQPDGGLAALREDGTPWATFQPIGGGVFATRDRAMTFTFGPGAGPAATMTVDFNGAIIPYYRDATYPAVD